MLFFFCVNQLLFFYALDHFDIIGRTISGIRFSIQIRRDESISVLRTKMQEKYGSSCLGLFFDGNFLHDDHTVANYYLKHGDVIQLVLPLRAEGDRKIPMKVGDVVELRSAVNGVNRRQVMLTGEIERNDKRVTKFAVEYIDNGEKGAVDATKIQRIRESVPAASNGVAAKLHNTKALQKSVPPETLSNCIHLRDTNIPDPNFKSLNLQLDMCSFCENGDPENCNRVEEKVEILSLGS